MRLPSPPPCVLLVSGLALGLGVAFGQVAAGDEGDPAPAKPTPIAALERFLERPDWLSRALAAKELSRRSEDGVVRAISKAIVVERDPRVLCLLAGALRGRAREDLLVEAPAEVVDRLIPLAREENDVLAKAAFDALARFPSQALDSRLEAYVSWWVRGRRAYRAEAEAAKARRAAASAPRPAPAPGETVTVPTEDTGKYEILDRIRREGLEVMICIDSTASMTEEISEAKASVRGLVARMRLLAPRFRVGLITYDDEARLVLALTTDTQALEQELSRVAATGGGDTEEGVDRAVLLALRQDRSGWSARAARSIVVLGDAPPHEEDVPRLLGAVRRARADVLYDLPVRVDTISASGGDTDRDGFVPHFAELARRGGGSAVRLAASRSLAWAIVAASFGPAWREPVLELLADLEALDRAAK